METCVDGEERMHVNEMVTREPLEGGMIDQHERDREHKQRITTA